MLKKLKDLKKLARGFTLIELLIVISIIAILSGIIILNSADARAKARNAKRKSDLNTIASALEAFYADFNAYPNGEGIFNIKPISYCPNLDWDGIDPEDQFMDSALLKRWPNFAASLNGAWNANTRRIWLWELVDRGYINRTPVDPLNLPATSVTTSVGGNIDFAIGGFNYAPGFTYLYMNNIPWDPIDPYNQCPSSEDYFGVDGARYYNADGTCVDVPTKDIPNLGTPHAQVYKLLVATERAGADRAFRKDGGNFNIEIILKVVKTPKGDKLRVGTDVGVFYEVFSIGASKFPEHKFSFGLNDFVRFDGVNACSF